MRFTFWLFIASVLFLTGCTDKIVLPIQELEMDQIKFREYENQMLDVKIEYPSHWTPYGPDFSKLFGEGYTLGFESKNCTVPCGFSLFVKEIKDPEFDFDEFANSELLLLDSRPINEVKTNFSNYPAFKNIFLYKEKGAEYFGEAVLFYTSQKVIGFSFQGHEGERDNYEKIFHHMLESLKVLKQEPLSSK